MNQAGLGNVWRIVFDNDVFSTLDTVNNPLDLAEVPFSFNGTNPAINSLPVVDLVARYLLENYSAQPFMLQEPVSRVNLLCHQPNMAAVKNTKNSQVLDEDFPIVDIGFPMIQSIFGANKNLIPFLNDGRLQECVDNGIIDISSGQITIFPDRFGSQRLPERTLGKLTTFRGSQFREVCFLHLHSVAFCSFDGCFTEIGPTEVCMIESALRKISPPEVAVN